MLISTLGGIAAAASTKPEYTGQAVLSAASPARAPHEDAVLAQGYVFFFNEPAYQTGLSERAKVTDDVTGYSARTAGLGPVFYITATATTADTARSAAAAMAQKFANEVNSQLIAQRDRTIAAMTEKLQEVFGNRSDPDALAAQRQLQQQVNEINADRANQVTVLQLDGGVSESGSGRAQTIGLALVGGLLLGCAVAILTGINSKRLVTDYDIAEKLGIEPLDVLPSPTDKRHSGTRGVRLRHLVNILVRAQGDRPTAIAIASASGGDAAGEIAEALATQRAAQGLPAVLVHADLHHVGDENPGLADLLGPGHPAEIEDVIQTSSENLHVIAPGKPSGDPYTLFDNQRVSRVLDALRKRANFIVVSSPALSRAGEAQVISDVTDGTLLIIEQGTQLDDAREAVRVVNQVGATLIGAVLAERDAGWASGGTKSTRAEGNPNRITVPEPSRHPE